MVGDIGISDPSYSELTFALMEDSGWYEVDWSWAEPMNWGADAGCNFIEQKCVVSDSPNFGVFCNLLEPANAKTQLCDYNHLHVGYCDLTTTNTPYPADFQYFTNPKQGSLDELIDYCPSVIPYSNKNCRNSGSTTT
jgi:leishmanolysin